MGLNIEAFKYDKFPINFFGPLRNGPNRDCYLAALRVFIKTVENERVFRISKNEYKEALANCIADSDYEYDDEDNKNIKNGGDADKINIIIAKLLDEDIGWFEEELEDEDYSKFIMITEPAYALYEFLTSYDPNKYDEASNYILDIYNNLKNRNDTWNNNPYVHGIIPICENVNKLRKFLKKLSSNMKKIIKNFISESSDYQSIYSEIGSYLSGEFIKQYHRLIYELNIGKYREYILSEFKKMRYDEELFLQIISNCMEEECFDDFDFAEQKVNQLFDEINDFITCEYDLYIKDIDYKIDKYLNNILARIEYKNSDSIGVKGQIDALLKMIEANPDVLSKINTNRLFNIDEFNSVESSSIKRIVVPRRIEKSTENAAVELSSNSREVAKKMLERLKNPPYSRRKSAQYLKERVGINGHLKSEDIHIDTKVQLIDLMMAGVYANTAGYKLEVLDEYRQDSNLRMRNIEFIRVAKDDE